MEREERKEGGGNIEHFFRAKINGVETVYYKLEKSYRVFPDVKNEFLDHTRDQKFARQIQNLLLYPLSLTYKHTSDFSLSIVQTIHFYRTKVGTMHESMCCKQIQTTSNGIS